jgi:hypothetical protein
MPELRIKDVRLPVLRLPEMSRDDIGKALGDVRRDIADASRDIADASRDIDLSKVELPSFELSRVEMPKIDVSRADISKAVESAAQAVGVRPRPRSRVPFVIAGIVTIALVAWAMLGSPLTPRLREAAGRVRERLDEARRGFDDEADEPKAFDAAVAVPVEPSAYSDAVTSTNSPFAEPPSDLPDGLGDGIGSGSMDEVART